MNRFGRKAGKWLWIVCSLILAVVAVVVMYYFETESREKYFNQLRLRELAATARGFDNQLASLVTLTREHRQLVEDDLGAIRLALKTLEEQPHRFPGYRYSSGIRQLVEAQAGLVLFDDDRCTRAPKDSVLEQNDWWPPPIALDNKECVDLRVPQKPYENCPEYAGNGLIWFATRFSRRNENFDLNSDCDDPRKEKCENRIRETCQLASAMCIAGEIALKSTEQLQNKKEDVLEQVKTLLNSDLLSTKALNPSSEDGGVELYKDLETAHTIAGSLRRSLVAFRNQLCSMKNWSGGDSGDSEDGGDSEKLTNYIQKVIAQFWNGKLKGDPDSIEFRSDRIRELAGAADPLEMVKSRRALQLMVETVEGRYMGAQSPLRNALKQHQLKVDFQSGDSLAPHLCSKIGEGQPVVLPYQSPGPYHRRSRYAVSSCVLKEKIAYAAPFSDLMRKVPEQFEVLLIADADGNVLFSSDTEGAGSGDFGASLGSLVAEVKGGKQGESEGAGQGGESAGKLLTYAGAEYLSYVLPHQTSSRLQRLLDENTLELAGFDTLYFVGLTPAVTASKLKFGLPLDYYITGFAIAFLILLAFVFLKLKMSDPAEAVTRWDRRMAVAAVVAIVTLLVVALVTRVTATAIKHDMDGNAKAALESLAKGFSEEVDEILLNLDHFVLNDPRLKNLADPGMDDLIKCEGSLCGKPDEVSSMFGSVSTGLYVNLDNEKGGAEWGKKLLDNILLLDRDGKIFGRSVRGTKKQVQPIKEPDLSQRRYFTDARDGNLYHWVLPKAPSVVGRALDIAFGELGIWSWPFITPELSRPGCFSNQREGNLYHWLSCGDDWIPVAVERIISIVSGETSTQVAIPLKQVCGAMRIRYSRPGFYTLCDELESKAGAEPLPEFLSVGFTLESLVAPVLPGDMKFAILEDRSGRVLFHSQGGRALVEDFLAETESDAELLSYLQVHGRDIPGHPAEVGEALVFDGSYRGQQTRFHARRLHPAIPWTLVVFYDHEYMLAFPVLMFGLSLLFCLVIAAVAVLGLVLLRACGLRHRFRRFWPARGCIALYRSGTRYMLSALAVMLLLRVLAQFWSTLKGALFPAAVVVWLLLLVYLVAGIDRWRRGSGDGGTTRDLVRSYSAWVCCIVIIGVGLPVLLVSNTVGGGLAQALQSYDQYRLEESRERLGHAKKAYYDRRIEEGERRKFFAQDERGDFSDTPKTGEDNWVMRRRDVSPPGADLDNRACYQSTAWTRGLAQLLTPIVGGLWDPAHLVGVLVDDRLRGAPEDTGRSPPGCIYSYHYPGALGLVFEVAGESIGSERIWSLLWWALVALLFVALTFYLPRFLAVYMFGARVRRPVARDGSEKPALVQKLNSDSGGPHHGLIVMPAERTLSLAPGVDLQEWDASELASKAAGIAKPGELFSKQLPRRRRALLLDNIESVAFDATARGQLLRLLERVVFRDRDISVVILCERHPLDILTKQELFTGNGGNDKNGKQELGKTSAADPREQLRWSTLFVRFESYYDWHLGQGASSEGGDNPALLAELAIWPELQRMREPLQRQCEALGSPPLEEDVLKLVETHARVAFRRRWNLCTQRERLVLLQLARDMLANPKNSEVLQYLMDNGYIVRGQGWRIATKSFKRFVLQAEPEEVFAEWLEKSHKGPWNILKVPLIAFAIAIVTIFAYSRQQGWESILAVLTGLLTLIPLVFKNLHLISRGNGSFSPPE